MVERSESRNFITNAKPLPLESASLSLRVLAPGDAPKLLRMSHEEGMKKWLPSQVYRDQEHASAVTDFLIAQFSAPGDPRSGPYVLGVILKSTGELIGHVGFSPLDLEVEIGFAIEETHQGQGYATEAVRTACEWVTEKFSIPSILGVTAVTNRASQDVLLRSGFVRQREEQMDFQGEHQHVVIFTFTGTGHAAQDI